MKNKILIFVFTLLLGACNMGNITFANFYSWINNLKIEDIKSVSLEKGYIGVAPTTPTDLTTSTDVRDFEYNLNVLKNTELIKTDNYLICGGSFMTLSFLIGNDVKEIRLNNYYLFVESAGKEELYLVKEKTPDLFKISYAMKS